MADAVVRGEAVLLDAGASSGGEGRRYSWDELNDIFSEAIDMGFDVTFSLKIVSQGQEVSLDEMSEFVRSKKAS